MFPQIFPQFLICFGIFGASVFAVSGRLARMARACAFHWMRDYMNILSLIIKLFKT